MAMSPLRRAFVILFVLILVVAFLLVIAQDQEVLHVRSAHPVSDPRSPAYMAALAGADLTSGNTYDVLTNGDEFFPAMLDAIRGARRRISFETYIYDSTGIAEQFTAAFESAARRGVRVNIVVDGIGGSMDVAHIERLRAAGCHVVRFNAPRWYAIEALNYRTHRKLLVVDGEIAFTGGAGIKDIWLGNAQDPNHWRDTQIRMRGPIARLIEGVFYENFAEAGSEDAPELDDEIPAASDDAPSFIVRGWSSGGTSDLKRVYLLALASAERTIDLTSPYFLTDESSRWSLQDAVRRGVRIRLLLEGDITDALPVKYASRDAYDDLLRLGIEIYEYQPTLMHAKVLVVDGVWSMFGSANFDNRSLELNDELNVAVTSPALAARFLQDFERDLRVSKKLELHTWRQRPRLHKFREHLWAAFGEIF